MSVFLAEVTGLCVSIWINTLLFMARVFIPVGQVEGVVGGSWVCGSVRLCENHLKADFFAVLSNLS